MKHTEPEIVTKKLLDELRRISPNDPDHLPREIELIEVLRQRHPKLPQVACFDTAFHQTMPRVAKLLPIPRRFDAKGIQRYGFHGLSYAYLMEELARLGDPAAKKGRVILAHLGNGASLAAVRDGKSIDTSMGFTPTAGLVMSTRSGDLDPGLAPYLARTEQMTTRQFYKMVNHESGLLGVSETSSDMRDLLNHEKRMCGRRKPWRCFVIRRKNGLAPMPPRSVAWTRSFSPAASAKTHHQSASAFAKGWTFLALNWPRHEIKKARR
jgi:acetate kinase